MKLCLHYQNTWKMCEFHCTVQPHNTVTYVCTVRTPGYEGRMWKFYVL